jgi:hypothetical protein
MDSLIHILGFVRVCVCVCEREREREREKVYWRFQFYSYLRRGKIKLKRILLNLAFTSYIKGLNTCRIVQRRA